MKCCILGSGTWGSALAQVLSDNGQDVIIYGRGIEEVNDINLNHVNSKYFGDDVKLSANIIATNDISVAVKEANIIIVAVPSIAYRDVLNKMKQYIMGK